jgi:3-isopropylmalate dehydratase small subunit
VTAGAVVHPFEVEPFARKLLLSGQDELGYLLSFMPQIEAFECRP